MNNNYPHITKDSKGNEIHVKFSDEYECWKEYDENGKCIHFKNSDGSEYWYDSNGNKIPDPSKKIKFEKDVTIDFLWEMFYEEDCSWSALFVRVNKGRWCMAKPIFGTEKVEEIIPIIKKCAELF